ncbi:MAG: DUF433 domain-containing protein [Nostoc sp. LLA-1]|nr:DUF433 domain-containing protein [Cyanocohniella sp. LLY]
MDSPVFWCSLSKILSSFLTNLRNVGLREVVDRITVNPNVCLGQPTIRGMGITVVFVLKLLASQLSIPEVLAAYPELEEEEEEEDIRQALNYLMYIQKNIDD